MKLPKYLPAPYSRQLHAIKLFCNKPSPAKVYTFGVTANTLAYNVVPIDDGNDELTLAMGNSKLGTIRAFAGQTYACK